MRARYCRNCGAENKADKAVCQECGFEVINGTHFCQNCGAETQPGQNTCTACGTKLINNNDSSSFGMAVLSFLIPLLGLILYIVWHKEKPLKAASAGKGALIGFIVGIVLYVIF